MKQNSKFLKFMEKEEEERKIKRLRAIVTFALITNAILAVLIIFMHIKG